MSSPRELDRITFFYRTEMQRIAKTADMAQNRLLVLKLITCKKSPANLYLNYFLLGTFVAIIFVELFSPHEGAYA